MARPIAAEVTDEQITALRYEMWSRLYGKPMSLGAGARITLTSSVLGKLFGVSDQAIRKGVQRARDEREALSRVLAQIDDV